MEARGAMVLAEARVVLATARVAIPDSGLSSSSPMDLKQDVALVLQAKAPLLGLGAVKGSARTEVVEAMAALVAAEVCSLSVDRSR